MSLDDIIAFMEHKSELIKIPRHALGAWHPISFHSTWLLYINSSTLMSCLLLLSIVKDIELSILSGNVLYENSIYYYDCICLWMYMYKNKTLHNIFKTGRYLLQLETIIYLHSCLISTSSRGPHWHPWFSL